MRLLSVLISIAVSTSDKTKVSDQSHYKTNKQALSFELLLLFTLSHIIAIVVAV